MFQAYYKPCDVPLLGDFVDPSSVSRLPSSSGDEESCEDDFLLWEGKTALSSIQKALIRILSTLKQICQFFLPSFIHYSAHEVKELGQNPPPTQYLHGLRGLAALCVYVQHFTVDYYGTAAHYGYRTRPEDNNLLLLPFVRLPFAGGIFMVALFFVLSGFALSYKPLKLARARKGSELLTNLASAIFRRGLRLFVPCLVPILLAELLMYNGWWGAGGGSDEIWQEPAPTPLAQFQDALETFKILLNPFTWNESFIAPAPQLWTLPMEFRGSLVVYLALLSLCKMKVAVRTLLLVAFAFFSIHVGRWEIFLFTWGILIAEASLRRQDASCDLKGFNGLHFSNIKPLRVITFLWIATLVSGLYFGGWPVFDAEAAPGFVWLSRLHPGRSSTYRLFFWVSVGAVQTVLALDNLEILQQPFKTRVAQYLGEISFSVYIVHQAVIYSLGRWVTPIAMRSTGSYHGGVTIGFSVVTIVTLWIADIHWRSCDRIGGIELGKWIYMKTLAE